MRWLEGIVRHLTCLDDISTADSLEVFRRAGALQDVIEAEYYDLRLCGGRVLATMFFEESTRTSAALQAAMVRLGGGWFGVSDAKGTYVDSGAETTAEALRGIAPMADLIAVRHPD